MQLYIHRSGEQLGPYTEEQLHSELAAGAVQITDLAWYEGADNWMPLSTVPGFARRSTPPPIRSTAGRTARPFELPQISRDALGSYASSTLQPNETPLYKTSVHWIIFVGTGLLAFLLLVLLVLPMAIFVQTESHSFAGWLMLFVPALIALPAVITYKTSELAITNRRVLIKVGLVQRRTLEMFISKIESVGVTDLVN